ncbi:Hypothetical protein, putative [Bodo saltans]|uniref:Membrane-associated protein n=1 Tax=Bodo saltans TaxID=75058 RepID=A0A0S4J0J2_BODSA|nr:Hypothetical protein, putative [Bodo saltans]|eukprot:CUG46242.1 Hypothetical protein, putative [Bodo saltans]
MSHRMMHPAKCARWDRGVCLLLSLMLWLLPPKVDATMIYTQDGRLSGVMVEANPINPATALLERIAIPGATASQLPRPMCVAGNGVLFVVTQPLYVVSRYTETGGATRINGSAPDAIYTMQCVASGVWTAPFSRSSYLFVNSSSFTAQPPLATYCGESTGLRAFYTSTFDGRYLWNVNYHGCLSRYDTTALVGESLSFPGYSSVVFDGTYVWLLPQASNDIIRVQRNLTYDTFPIAAAPGTLPYYNGVFVAPNSLYLFPGPTTAGPIVIFNTADQTSTALNGSYVSYTAA